MCGGALAWFGASDCQRGVDHSNGLPPRCVRARCETRAFRFQDRINDARHCFGRPTTRRHRTRRYPVLVRAWAPRRRSPASRAPSRDLGGAGPCRRPMRDDDHPEGPAATGAFWATASRTRSMTEDRGSRQGESEAVTKRGAVDSGVGYQRATGTTRQVSASGTRLSDSRHSKAAQLRRRSGAEKQDQGQEPRHA